MSRPSRPMPPDLQSALGPAPLMAEAVAPAGTPVAFDDLTLKYQDNTRLGALAMPIIASRRA